ncbi:MAG: sugar MFS transporter [Acidobacteriota bacterium]
MSVAAVVFFSFGFLTCLNDVISPHLKSIFALSYSEMQNVPLYFFSSYFVFSYPSGKLVERLGYKKATVTGLLVMALGALGFLPAAQLASFPMFLAALVILAGGMTIVQVAINPYVTVIGPRATAASRLNLAQAFNSVGTFIAPALGTALILRNAKAPLSTEQLHTLSALQQQLYRAEQASTVRLPYLILAVGLSLLALALALIKLRSTTGVSEHTQDFRPGAFAEAFSKPDTIWRHPWLLFAAVGIFVYVGAEVSIGNLLVSYIGLPKIAGLPDSQAGYFLMVYWGGAMVGRFIGSALLQKMRNGVVLGVAAIGAFALVILSLVSSGHIAMGALLAVGLCNSIMFPTIFTLGIQDLGPLTSKGSSLLIAAILGGALVPKLQGMVANKIGLQPSFFIPAICYIYVAAFGIAAIRRPPAREGVIPVEPV